MSKIIATFFLHVLLAMVVSVVFGGLICAIVQTIIGPVSPQYWVNKLITDAPYSPALWGSSLVLGFLVNRRLRSRSASWVWALGLAWLSIWVWGAIDSYHASSCQGCSVTQNVWRNLFTISEHACSQDCLPELFGTTPVLNAFAYSLGASLGLRSAQVENPITEKQPENH